ncbi:MAG: DUF4145 domain-containing protein [Hydrogenovibrio sp.]|uniref:DUF4145 domain-containing protein n=1 Tax=Hydrogenovibrio sp. TaxID=2065821 RepID=UPI002870AF60|nr:DUF4145 domain-containing protein [Hydrogenovibrio sp.]MDR9498840.1 DUF4145 domain-containing protein [Hydrogenovibrio sp.]
MSELVADCPRCSAKRMTFDLLNQVPVSIHYGWQHWLEVFCVCRNCHHPTIFLVVQKDINDGKYIQNDLSKLEMSANEVVEVKRFVGIQDNNASQPPEHLPEQIDSIFREGASCMAIGCNNAAATMFRLCLDLATQSLLPENAEGLNSKVRRNLGLRLPWLFDQEILPEALRELSACIKDDGNDGAHEGVLGEEDAADILDFTFILLERLYTEPKRLELAAQRRIARRRRDS